MKILICDDDYHFAEELKKYLLVELPADAQLYLCSDREELTGLLSAVKGIDLLLMDICLEQDDGILLSKKILEQFPEISVIFITGYPELFYETVYLSVRPCGFVKKPVNRGLLLSLVRQVIQEKQKENRDWIYLRTQGSVRKILPFSIRYIESQKHILHVHNDKEILESYGRIKDIFDLLPDYFFHCHKSFLVNAHYIQNYVGDHFVLDDGTHISISQTRRKMVRQQFFQYLDRQPMLRSGGSV